MLSNMTLSISDSKSELTQLQPAWSLCLTEEQYVNLKYHCGCFQGAALAEIAN